jgi:hypothetical protein
LKVKSEWLRAYELRKDGAMDFFLPEMVNVVMDERSRDAASIRVSREAGSVAGRERVRSRLAVILATAAARIHAEAARAAIGLQRVPRLGECGGAKCGSALCLCDD